MELSKLKTQGTYIRTDNRVNSNSCKPNIWIMNHYATNMFRNLGGRHFYFADKLIERGYRSSIICANTSHNSEKVMEIGSERFAVKTAGEIPFVLLSQLLISPIH